MDRFLYIFLIVASAMVSCRSQEICDESQLLQVVVRQGSAEQGAAAPQTSSFSAAQRYLSFLNDGIQLDEPLSVNTTTLSEIFTMCVVLYSLLGAAWLGELAIARREGAKSNEGAFRVILLVLSWAATSVSLHVINKTLVSHLEAPMLVTAVQMLTASTIFVPSYWSDLRRAPVAQIWRWLVVPFMFAFVVTTSSIAYEYMSLTLYTVVRNLTPVLVYPIESMVMPAGRGPKKNWQSFTAMVVLGCSVVIYSTAESVTVSPVGIIMLVMSVIVAIADALVQRRLLIQECKDLTTGSCCLINFIVGVFPVMLLAFLAGEIHNMRSPPQLARWADARVLVLLFTSGILSSGMCFLTLEVQRAISVTSFCAIKNVSKMVVVVMAVVFFGDEYKSAHGWGGLLLSLVGALIYAQSQRDDAAEPSAEKPV